MDSIDMGAYGGLKGAKQKWVQVIVDPATRYAAASMHGGKSVDSRYTIENIVRMITSLRDGPLKYDEKHKGNVFKPYEPDGTLVNQLRLATDSGAEFDSDESEIQVYDEDAVLELKDLDMARVAFLEWLREHQVDAPTEAAATDRVWVYLTDQGQQEH